MPCCGKQIRSIAAGHINLAIGRKLPTTDDKLNICKECEEHTWLSPQEYYTWLLAHGIKVITHFMQLDKLPALPKHSQTKIRNKLCCRLCKCDLEAKARSDADCVLGLWPQK